MQAKGENGELLKNIAQHIIENNQNTNNNITVLTNNSNFQNLDENSLKNELINIKYTPNNLDLNTVLLQLNKRKTLKTNTLNKNIIISDFQVSTNKNKIDFTNVNSTTQLLQVTPSNNTNIFIDSVFITTKNIEEITVNVRIKSSKISNLSVPVSLFESEKLVGKSTAQFKNNQSKTIQFTIPNTTTFNGKITLVDNFLTFDNDFYFSVSAPSKINVLSIGKSSSFLAKIYTENEFNFTTTPLPNLNYNTLQNQHLILLNELENIPQELVDNLLSFSKNGGSIVIIPAINSNLNSYNSFLKTLQIGTVTSKIEQEHQITTINYSHPLIKDVFEKKVTNFQYPTASIYFENAFYASTDILKFDHNSTFISSTDFTNSSVYWVASPLEKNTSNFTQSSLIVPVFYNFAKQSLHASQLYYTISPTTTIDVATSIEKDEVLTVSNTNTKFIPLQTISQNKVRLHFENNILKSGFYTIFRGENAIKTIAFNYNRTESNLNYLNVAPLIAQNEKVSMATSLEAVFKNIHDEQKINWLFKWFLAFSVLFLFIEMLILKYFNI
ncbi:hypothetical protein ACFQ5N_10765 [Lutibacter holmesii]|uniref:Uncharacterized protein n=1 Tax=Lutibacter holmesii TaxID=1137985 RepID=A0ABW3WQ90_9FLAO